MRKFFAALLIALLVGPVFGQGKRMIYKLTPIIENLQPWAWYPLNEITDTAIVTTVEDASGNGRDLVAAGLSPDCPTGTVNILNGFPVIRHNEESPLIANDAVTVKHLFIVTRYTGASTFNLANRGLISESEGVPTGKQIFTGLSTDTKFIDQSITGLSYYKSQTSYAAANQQAPFANFELLEFSTSTGQPLDDVQVGQKNDDDANRWIGDWADLIIFDSVLTEAQVRGVRIYFDLKYGLWRTNSTTLYFPDPEATGINWYHFNDNPIDWGRVTRSHEYDDDGRSFNTVTDDPTRYWDIEYTGLTAAEAEIFDTFADAVRNDRTFSLVDKYGVTQTGLRVVEYRRSHDGHRSWVKSVSFRLAKYPE